MSGVNVVSLLGKNALVRFYIFNHERKQYWNGNRHGYTSEISDAGQFSLDEALEICETANSSLTRNGILAQSIIPVVTRQLRGS